MGNEHSQCEQCPLCSLDSLETKRELRSHVIKSHQQDICLHCYALFDTYEALQIHCFTVCKQYQAYQASVDAQKQEKPKKAPPSHPVQAIAPRADHVVRKQQVDQHGFALQDEKEKPPPVLSFPRPPSAARAAAVLDVVGGKPVPPPPVNSPPPTQEMRERHRQAKQRKQRLVKFHTHHSQSPSLSSLSDQKHNNNTEDENTTTTTPQSPPTEQEGAGEDKPVFYEHRWTSEASMHTYGGSSSSTTICAEAALHLLHGRPIDAASIDEILRLGCVMHPHPGPITFQALYKHERFTRYGQQMLVIAQLGGSTSDLGSFFEHLPKLYKISNKGPVAGILFGPSCGTVLLYLNQGCAWIFDPEERDAHGASILAFGTNPSRLQSQLLLLLPFVDLDEKEFGKAANEFRLAVVRLRSNVIYPEIIHEPQQQQQQQQQVQEEEEEEKEEEKELPPLPDLPVTPEQRRDEQPVVVIMPSKPKYPAVETVATLKRYIQQLEAFYASHSNQ